MPPRFSYWTIPAGGLPTSFRAAEREDLLPTLRRLQERHPDAEMKWFQRGKLWSSPEEAQSAFQKPAEQRPRDWRPGGEHRDPREPFKKQKRERNQARRQQRFDRKHGGVAPKSPERERHITERQPRTDRPRTDWPRSEQSRSDRPRSDRPRTDRPRTDRPRVDRPRNDGPPGHRPGPRAPSKGGRRR